MLVGMEVRAGAVGPGAGKSWASCAPPQSHPFYINNVFLIKPSDVARRPLIPPQCQA